MNIMPNNIVQPPAQLHVLSIDVLPRSGTKVPTQVLAVERTKPLSPEFGEFAYRMGTAQIYGAQVNTGRARLQSGRKKAAPKALPLCRRLAFPAFAVVCSSSSQPQNTQNHKSNT